MASLVASSLVTAVCAISCGMGEDKPSPCEADGTLCPTSSRLATDLACDCRCVAGYAGLTPTRAFEGTFSACLPPSLNPNTATPEQRAQIDAMSDVDFNQSVYKFCSDDVAGFLDELIEQQQRPNELDAICMGPRIRCTCSTSGAHEQTPTCSEPCADRECDQDNCLPLLKVGGSVDTTGCACSRVNTCGGQTPASTKPPMCMNRVAAVLRRAKHRRRVRRDRPGRPLARRQRCA